MGWACSQNERTRFGRLDRTRRDDLSPDLEDVSEHISGNNCPGVWDLDTSQFVYGSEVCRLECCEQGHASQYVWIRQLGDDDLCLVLQHRFGWILVVEL